MNDSILKVNLCVLALSLGTLLPRPAVAQLEKAPATDNSTIEAVQRMIGSWDLVNHQPAQKEADRTRAEYIAKGLLLVGTPKDVLIKNLCAVPVAKTVEISKDVIKVGRTEYQYAPGRGKLVVFNRGDKMDKRYKSVYEKIGAREIQYRFETDGTLTLETNSLKELGGKTIRYTLARAAAQPSSSADSRLERAGYRLWTSEKGSSLEAKILSIGETTIILKDKSGKERSVPIQSLSYDDRIYIKSLSPDPLEDSEISETVDVGDGES
jgi:hypothetical protein